ncbi:hypothetical protein [Pseudoalteromonas sp. MMG005]|uniref:crAss001_48 related protein n=1 Tax=Pseudoalteromonas sp. MMG005 TaxID=2822682 RepID=UPI001B39EA2F|nr:hypothetical protein [Pseudoalteromonas sp. MMG005]MBQ4844399.1 hypothetical protein [Pseudoalteromonas sp. MMG005]
MSGFISRVIEEKKELDLKLEKLNAFLESSASDELCKGDEYLLRRQRQVMTEYSCVLSTRIERFWGTLL